MPTLIRGSSPKSTVYTNANTSFPVWKGMVTEAFKEREFDPGVVNALSIKHAWEGGDTPMSFVDREIFRQAREKRSNEMKRIDDLRVNRNIKTFDR